MPEPTKIPMPPHYYDPATGRGPTTVHPDRCPAGHIPQAKGGTARIHHTPVRPGQRRESWTCYACAPADNRVRGREFHAAPELYDVDPATWYWDPYQVRRRREFQETLRRSEEHRAEHFAGEGW